MALGIREIADLILLDIEDEQLVPQYGDQLDMRNLYESEKYNIYGDKLYQAVKYLHDSGFIVGDNDANGITIFFNLTTKGNLRIEEMQNRNKINKNEKNDGTGDFAQIIGPDVSSFEMVKMRVSHFSEIDQIILYEGVLRDLEIEGNYPYLIFENDIKGKIRAEIQYLEKVKELQKEKETKILNMKNDREFYNDYSLDIIHISKHYDNINDPFLQKNYLDWLLKFVEERFIETMANKSDEEMNTREYKNGIFLYNSIKQYIEEKNKSTTGTEDKNIIQKITWLGNRQDLIYLFESLERLGFIEYSKDKNQLLDIHFNVFDKKTKTIKDLDPKKIADIRGKINTPNSLITPKESIKDVISMFADKNNKIELE